MNLKKGLIAFCSKVPFLRLIKFPIDWFEIIVPEDTITKKDIEDWNNPAKIKEYAPIIKEQIIQGQSASNAYSYPRTCKWCGQKIEVPALLEGDYFCGLKCESEYTRLKEKEDE